MKIFVLWAEKPGNLDLRILFARLTDAGHEIAYFAGHAGAESITPAGAIFHYYGDAIAGRAPDALQSVQFSPLDEATIRRFYHTESIALSMMNRFFDGEPVDLRRRRYYEALRYWLGVLRRFVPDAVIFPNMPHFFYDFVAYDAARALGVKTIFFDDTRLPGRLLLLTDLWRGSGTFRREQKRAQMEQVSVSDLAGDIRAYYEPRTRHDFNATPQYIVDQKKKHSLVRSLLPLEHARRAFGEPSRLPRAPRFFTKTLIRELPRFFFKVRDVFTALLLPNARAEYARLAHTPDFGRKFVYVPLQKQPERTTSPQGDMFADQALALEILSASLPSGWVIYAKEHPLQWRHFGVRYSSFRYRGFYERLARIPGVLLVPIEIDSYRLINESQAVSAVTGSAGWEAVLRSKPALIFGTVWYEDCPGVFKVVSAASCREALGRIAGGFQLTQEPVVRYLKAFERSTIRAYISATAGKASSVGKEECMRNIADAVIQELNNC